jgi:hypothetical protein
MNRLLVILSLLLPAVALAQTPPYAYPITVGTSSVQVLSADLARKRAVFFNPNATALVTVCPTLTCAVGGVGSLTLLPYTSFPIDGYGQNGVIPLPWSAISDTPGAGLTILEFE